MVAGVTQAADGELFQGGAYVTPMFSHTLADSNRGTGDGSGVSLALGYKAEIAAMEVAYFARSLGRADLSGGTVSALFMPFSSWRPWQFLGNVYGLVGVGMQSRENHPGYQDDRTTVLADAGLGYLFPVRVFGFDLLLRGEGRYRLDQAQPPHEPGAPHSFNDIVLGLGVQIALSRQAQPAMKPEPVVVTPVTE